MDTVSSPSADVRPTGRPAWYFVLAGTVAAAAVLTSALIPAEIYGLVWAPLAVGFSFVDRAITRSSPVSIRLRRGAVVYVVVIAIVLVGALVAAAAFVRDREVWVAWSIAVPAFFAVAAGSWVVDRRLSEAVPTTPPS